MAKFNWKSIVGWGVAIAVIFGIIGYNAYQEHLKSQTDKKRVYAILPITGGFAFQGKEEQKTMQVWMQNHPNAPFELEILDNESNPTKSLTLAQRAAMNDDSPLFIVPTGAMGYPILPKLKEMNGFMILSPSTKEEDGTYKEFQRISFGSADMNKPLIDYVSSGKTVVIMHSNDMAGHTGATKTEETLTKNGAKVVEKLAFDTKELDMRIITLKAMSYKSDIIFVISPPTIGFINVIKELKTQEYPGVVLSDPALRTPSVVSQLGKNADGVYTSVMPTERIYKEYPEVAKALTENGLELYNFPINIWDIMDVVNHFVSNDIPFTQDEFLKMKKWHGISGDIEFTENGNSSYPFVLSIVKDGKFIPVESEDK
ncbi:MAG: amino acid ABC transporter substrate-binding protein [Alphaproteobacteria bacterium]|nr:amino acid ABC transporter substrate-binding protein [Alphaproteobacteria bacterium]